jgi:hypothetical protein
MSGAAVAVTVSAASGKPLAGAEEQQRQALARGRLHPLGRKVKTANSAAAGSLGEEDCRRILR